MSMPSLLNENNDFNFSKFEDLSLNECMEPSAPTLTQLQDENTSPPVVMSNESKDYGHYVQPDKTYSFMAAQPIPKPAPDLKMSNHKKLPTIVVTSNHVKKSRHRDVDPDGFTRNGFKRKMTTGSKKTFENASFKSPNRLNIRSYFKNIDETLLTLKNSIDKVDIIIMSETWLNSNTVKLCNISGFNGFHNYRESKICGGISIFVKDDLQSQSLGIDTNNDIWNVWGSRFTVTVL